MQIYYKIWADAILSLRKHHPKKKNWKFTVFSVITVMHSFNLMIIMIWLQYFKIFSFPALNIDVFPGTVLNGALNVFIPFATPFAILNYFLIFHKNRYEKIIEKYKDNKTKYALTYSMTIIILTFVSGVLYGILTHQGF